MLSSLSDCAAGKAKGLTKLWPAALVAITIGLIALFYACPSCNSDAVWLSLQPSSPASLIAPEFARIPKPISSPELSQEERAVHQEDKVVYHSEEPHLTGFPTPEEHRNSSDSDVGFVEVDTPLNASDKSSYTPTLEILSPDEPVNEVQADEAENGSHHGEFLAPAEQHANVPEESHDEPNAPRIDQDLVAAKRAIIYAEVTPNIYLHAPIYRNVTMFFKSYELMEQVFKVYTYKEGDPPLVHIGPTTGIYASEGRFIQQLQGSGQFGTDDPKKAHLFFMPYSVTNMVRNLYVPDSHDMQPVVGYATSYVDLIASKYPYWNASHGADHFFVSCHDWGPATARKNPELRRNAIKVVCNADEKEEFVIGKDMSLPETYMHAAKPPKKLGGLPIRKRRYLAFFAGQVHGWVRPILLQYWKEKDDDMRIYEKIPPSIARKTNYVRHMRASKFCICPRGYEVNSPRIVEAIYYDCVPVIIADDFVLPFSEVLNWPAFSVLVAERDIPNLKQILLSIPKKNYAAMQANLKHVRQHFKWHFGQPMKYDVFHMILHSLWVSRLASVSVNTT